MSRVLASRGAPLGAHRNGDLYAGTAAASAAARWIACRLLDYPWPAAS